ncbi:MAG: EF-hand domain-containing protein [Sphingobium sp.]|nr:EF-hand domain-containing protein [Sphingobium sp.]
MRSVFKLAMLLLATTVIVDKVQAQGGGGGPPNFMALIDTDKDGKVSQAEYTAFAEQRWGRLSQGADKVKVADLQGFQANALAGIAPDANGEVTKAAYLAAQPAKFKAADTNGDGSLSEAELMASFPRRGGGGGN